MDNQNHSRLYSYVKRPSVAVSSCERRQPLDQPRDGVKGAETVKKLEANRENHSNIYLMAQL